MPAPAVPRPVRVVLLVNSVLHLPPLVLPAPPVNTLQPLATLREWLSPFECLMGCLNFHCRCSSCGTGTYSAVTGASSCSTCSAGKYRFIKTCFYKTMLKFIFDTALQLVQHRVRHAMLGPTAELVLLAAPIALLVTMPVHLEPLYATLAVLVMHRYVAICC